MARDMHDILGHSLTTVTLKAELAKKLIELDPNTAKSQIAEIEEISRSALAEVRTAINGYRELSLSGELARALSLTRDAI
ncbi:histidine kinase dimerization/phosphoacceptor domain-containing protein [Corynebacterium striatum]|uniref:histidine kinase dimerization/phosphoacceptor domain-containing protein n=1 Tax=Corynebacterium striatum TaxID=43770 RepID=UPI003F8134DA